MSPYEKKKSHKGRNIAILVIALLVVIGVVLAIFLPKHNNDTKDTTEYSYMNDFSTVTDENGETVTQESTHHTTTDDPNNDIVKVDLASALEFVNDAYPDYSFNIEGMSRQKDGNYYYEFEGVDSHGTVKNVLVNAKTGKIVEK